MTSKPMLIAIACGLLTALMFISPTSLGFIGVILAPFMSLPLFVSVLGFGTAAGAVSGGVAALVMGIIAGPLAAIFFLVFQTAAPLWAGYMAGLSRDDDGPVEWFSLSIIFFRITVLCAAIVVALEMATSILSDQLPKMIGEVSKQAILLNPRVAQNTAQFDATLDLLVRVMPYAMPGSLLLFLAINYYLGAKFSRAKGWMLRPADHIPTATALPAIALAIFAIALALSLTSGPLAMAGKIFAGAFGMAFMLVGLATLHTLLTTDFRGAILGVTYLLLLLFPPFLFFMVILGIAETLFDLRARRLSSHST